jgi:hypothetical protein
MSPLDVRENCFNFKAFGGDGKRLIAAAKGVGESFHIPAGKSILDSQQERAFSIF